MFGGRKGFIGDTLTIALVVFILAVVGYFAVMFFSGFNDSVQVGDTVSSEAKTISSGLNTRIPKGLDDGIVLFFVLAYILTIFMAFQIGTNPGFFFVSLFIFIMLLSGLALFSNMGSDILGDSALSSARSSMPKTFFLMDNLLMISIALGALLLIVTFSKGGQQQ